MVIVLKKILIFFVLIFIFGNTSYAKKSDYTVYEAYSEVCFESDKKISDQYITRSEFVAVLMKLYEYTKDIYLCSFNDIYDSSWEYRYIANAETRMIAKGDFFGSFNPDKNVTVEEAIAFISRTAKIKYKPEDNFFTTAVGAREYASEYIEYAVINGLYPYINANPIPSHQDIEINTALELIENYLNFTSLKRSNLDLYYGYPKITESGRSNCIGINVMTTEPCTVFYKITEANNEGSVLIPRKEDINSHLVTVAKAEYETKVNIPAQSGTRYNIYFILRDNDGNSSKIYTLKDAMISPFTIGDGTEHNPYRIYTSYQLDQVRYYPDKHFLLCNDIDYNSNWVPIGGYENDEEKFSGIFDGGGHSISGLEINGREKNGFISVLDGTVKNLTLEAEINGHTYSGIIAGESVGGIIENCHVSGKVFADGNIAGGIVGKNQGTVRNCVSAIETVNAVSYSGGVAGTNYGDIINCLSCAQIVMADMYASSISGANIDGCIKNCVAASTELVDVMTKNSGRITTNRGNGITKNNYAYNDMISGVNVYIGENTQDGAEVLWQELTDDKFYREKLSWNFNSVWTFENSPEFMLPCIKNISSPIMVSGESIYTPLSIYSEEQLKNINYNLNGHYILRNNIILSGSNQSVSNWVPIGITENDSDISGGFTGSIDGNGFYISGIRITGDENIKQYGLIGKLTGGTVRNLDLKNIDISGYNKVGAVAAINYGRIENCNVSGNIYSESENEVTTGGVCAVNYTIIYDCNSHVNIKNSALSATVGGIAGINEGFIHNCLFNSKIESFSKNSLSNSMIGGICGANYEGMIYECASNANLEPLSYRNYCGGIAGLSTFGEIYKCSAKGKIKSLSQEMMSSYTYAGGIAGMMSNGLIMNSFSQSDISVSADNTYCGGILGYSEQASVQNTYSVNTINQSGRERFNDSNPVFAGGIVGYNENGNLSGNVAINPYILTNGYYAPVCAYSNGGYTENNFAYEKISSSGKVSDKSISGESVKSETLKNTEFYFMPVEHGGKLGWINDINENVWTCNKSSSYKFPILSNLKGQNLFIMPEIR